jgi:rod shape-determining protein MreC
LRAIAGLAAFVAIGLMSACSLEPTFRDGPQREKIPCFTEEPVTYLHIAFDGHRAIVVDKGSTQGVEVGMAVVSGSGLVGQVTSVGRRSARVLLITDPLSGVDALIQGNRARGIIEGNGKGSCAWKFVLREEDVKIGDRVTSSGLDGVYPRGLLIGIVTEISSRPDSMFHDVVVRPSIDMEKIESVYIVSSQHSEVK